jgi:hypothetical protein
MTVASALSALGCGAPRAENPVFGVEGSPALENLIPAASRPAMPRSGPSPSWA